MRQSALIPFSHEHHHALRLCVLLLREPQKAEGPPPDEIPPLLQHFHEEEQQFAFYWQALNAPKLRQRFEEEHRFIRELCHELMALCPPDAPTAAPNSPEESRILRLRFAFAEQLRNHIRFEERELFPAFERLGELSRFHPEGTHSS